MITDVGSSPVRNAANAAHFGGCSPALRAGASHGARPQQEVGICQAKFLPEPRPEQGKRRVPSDGSEYVERFRLVTFNPVEQYEVRQVRVEKWISGKLVSSEERTLHRTLYLPNAILLMLEVPGFRQITIRGDFTEDVATPESKELIFTALN